MKRSKTALLCAGIAAVLLAATAVTATADRQTESYSCPQTEQYSCLLTETYSCTRNEPYPCTQTEEYSCLLTETYSCTETEYYSCTQQRLVERCVTRSVPYTCTQTRRRCEDIPSSTGPDVTYCWDEEYETTCYRDEEDCWDEWETYRTRCSREVDATCEREVTGTCTRQVAATCTREVDATCEREYTGTCERQVDRTCTRTDPHTHSIYCTMPDGASEGGYTSGTMTGNSNHTSTHHDPQYQCSEKQARANQWLRDNPVCTCSGCASAGLSGAGDRMSASACSELNARAERINNPDPDDTTWVECPHPGHNTISFETQEECDDYRARNEPIVRCVCPDCDEAGSPQNGMLLTTSACDTAKADAAQWLIDNQECACPNCEEARVRDGGTRMSTTACIELNQRANRILNMVECTHPGQNTVWVETQQECDDYRARIEPIVRCVCPDCEEAGRPQNGMLLTTSACDTAKADAAQWLTDNPKCRCPQCERTSRWRGWHLRRMPESDCAEAKAEIASLNFEHCNLSAFAIRVSDRVLYPAGHNQYWPRADCQRTREGLLRALQDVGQPNLNDCSLLKPPPWCAYFSIGSWFRNTPTGD